MIVRKIKNDSTSCPYCAAPALTRICKYCGQPTGLEQDIAIASMEYPVIDYKNSHYDKKAYSTLLSISAVSGLMALLFVFILSKGADEPILRPVALLFGVASIGLLLLAVMWARNAYMTRTYGKDYTALVLGDVDNKELDFDNTQGEKTVKLLIRTNKGYRIILHKLGLEDSESYIKNKQAVKIRYFKKKYMIAENDRR